MIILEGQYIYEFKKLSDNLRYIVDLPTMYGVAVLDDELIEDVFHKELKGFKEDLVIKAVNEYIEFVNHLSFEFKQMYSGIKDHVNNRDIFVDKKTGEYFVIARELGTSLVMVKYLSKKMKQIHNITINDIDNSFRFDEYYSFIKDVLANLYTIENPNRYKSVDEIKDYRINVNNDLVNNNSNIYDSLSIIQKVCYFACFILLVGILDFPYEFYIFLRILVFILSLSILYKFYVSKINKNQSVLIAIAALLYNPIVPIHLTKEIWIILNILTALLFFYCAYILNIRKKRN